MTSKKSKSSKPSNVKKGFACLKCGYEAYKLAALSHCPLCIRCKGCNAKVEKCRCKESQ